MKLLALLFVSGLAFADATVDKPAPDFKVKDALGKEHSLKDSAGKWLVLEWYNRDCPYVKKHYESGNMQKIQKTYTGKGVNWLTVISSAPGKQGHFTPEEAIANAKKFAANANAVLIDDSGAMGKAYGAKTTPHMYIIDPKGTLVYAGAIDDNDSASPKVIEKSKNYVVAALDAGLAGKAVETKTSKPYGCSVKYKD